MEFNQHDSASSRDFEDRMRSLILTNTSPGTDQASFPPLQGSSPRHHRGQPSQSGQFGNPTFGQLPPGQVPDLGRVHESTNWRAPQTGPSGGPAGPTGSNVPRASRKRPNQAQRRQMSAQLSIPIDPRPVPPPAPHSARPYISPPAQSNHHYHRHHQSASFHKVHGPPSAPWYEGSRTPGSPWTPVTPYSSQHGHPNNDHFPFGAPQFQYAAAPGAHNTDHSAPHLTQTPVHPDAMSPRATRNPQGNLFNSRRQPHVRPEEVAAQAALLDSLCVNIVANAEIQIEEIAEKENFRIRIEQICREAIAQFESEHNGAVDFPEGSVQLKCFGSLSSGFATRASDMDLGLLSPLSQIQPDAPSSPIPRLIEKAFLDRGLGARLLSKTRVPIIKLCEKPPQSLYRDLVDEQEKWERGLDNHADVADDEDAEEAEALRETGHPEHTEEPTAEGDSKADGVAGREDCPEKKLASFRQSEHASLSTYYNHVKRLLRKLGGHDVTISNYRDFSPDDEKLLNAVCQAFVRGLHDKQLRARLESYCSLNQQSQQNQRCFRSLLGVCTQVEGEKIFMLWEKRQISDRNSELREQAEEAFESWQRLQNKVSFGEDPVFFTKELQLALSKISRLPSVQLVTLEQNQHESPAAYYSRALRIFGDLHNNSDVHDPDIVRWAVSAKYAAGIFQESVRQTVKEFMSSAGEDVSFQAIARRHKSLHLAMEFERALEKGMYPPEDLDSIKKYINVLRGPMTKSRSSNEHYDWVVGLSGQMSSLVEEVKELADPSKMTPNQPRDPYRDRLEFPKTGAGVQCDINFSAHLALQNTLLLRCYSHSDPRVRPLVLFVKHWAKVRGINSGYRGTLSSYGYVLMVLHYLVNIAYPFVCPNLQQLARPPKSNTPVEERQETQTCKGRNVAFWRNEQEIIQLAQANQLNTNHDSIGHLLRGFFEYYAQNGMMSAVPHRGFDWGREVLSLRTTGGLLTKNEKGWIGAKTTIQIQPQSAIPTPLATPAAEQVQTPADSVHDPRPSLSAQPSDMSISEASAKSIRPTQGGGEVKEVRHRYLFAIEDPFELDHNVARTVTHNGIVSIRDEFRRAWRIIRNSGTGSLQEDLLQDVSASNEADSSPLVKLITEIHGQELFD